MVLKIFVLLTGCVLSSGCITILKQQIPQKSQQSDVCTDLDKRPAMVWVEAKTNKIWVGPQLDDNGDMVEGHYKYTVITPGHWDMKNDGHE